MAYVRSKHLRFVFEDEPGLEGLEVRTKRVSIDMMREIMQLNDGIDTDGMSEEDMFATFQRPFTLFADALVSWNLEEQGDDGEDPVPVPATKEALLADIPWSIRLVKAWMRGVTSVTDDLGKGSDSGETTAAPPLPMEPRSPSPESLPMPA